MKTLNVLLCHSDRLVITHIPDQDLDKIVNTPIRMAQQYVERFHLLLVE